MAAAHELLNGFPATLASGLPWCPDPEHIGSAATFAATLRLLRHGAGTVKSRAFRPQSPDRVHEAWRSTVRHVDDDDYDDDTRHSGRNTAALFVACVALVDSEPSADVRRRLVADTVELFGLLAEAPGPVPPLHLLLSPSPSLPPPPQPLLSTRALTVRTASKQSSRTAHSATARQARA